ncbi:hypothetical protein IJ707_05915, partial [bacterium]|nr:hypothetical protein [bacterium]
MKNKLTKETLDIPYSEFRIKLQKRFRTHLKVIAKPNLINTRGTSMMTILWSLLFILNYNGISIILEIAT